MNTDYERDVRNTDPNQDNRRLGAFKKGWNTFVDGEDMTSGTLKSLTFENLGYRMAALSSAKFRWQDNESLVERAYQLSVDLQEFNRRSTLPVENSK